MKSAPLKFALVSLGLHMLGLLGVLENTVFESAAVSNNAHSGTASTLLIADIIPEERNQEHDGTLGNSKSSEPLVRSSVRQLAKLVPTAPPDADKPEQEEKFPALPLQDYLAAGTLTRQPSPVTNIDLDVAEVKEVAVPGSVRLTILIDTDGTVVQVFSANKDNALQAFSDRVTEIFKRARFSPGEVNGTAVKAQLEIDIVSESIQTL